MLEWGVMMEKMQVSIQQFFTESSVLTCLIMEISGFRNHLKNHQSAGMQPAVIAWLLGHLFKDLKTGSAFYVFNAHFDHQGVVARKESSLLVLEKIRAIAGENPVIFMGDLNGDHESEWYSSLRASPLLYDALLK
jgi:endonuclease/exonuclease/phosphatase family metal-dependent hydrolase